MFRFVKIIVSYDGSLYNGWQIQPTDRTVAGTIEKTYQLVFQEAIKLIGASRTDSGVHALAQVARFKTRLALPEERMKQALNNALPQDIVIRDLTFIDESFHPCVNVKQKTYWYTLFTARPLPFIAPYGWHYKYIDMIDWDKFRESLSIFVGRHDFTSFCKNDAKKDPVRVVDSINVTKIDRWKMVRIEIKGKSFLRYQIRRMVGNALHLACHKSLSADYIREMLDACNPQQKLIKAEAGGLCLRKIAYYPRDEK